MIPSRSCSPLPEAESAELLVEESCWPGFPDSLLKGVRGLPNDDEEMESAFDKAALLGSSSVALVCDARVSMPANLAQGAAMAVEEAAELAGCLVEHGPSADAVEQVKNIDGSLR